MSDAKVRKVGTVRLAGKEYDLAMNGRGVLGEEGLDLYDRPATKGVPLKRLIEGPPGISWDQLAQELVTLLAQAMIERDAALASLQKGS